MSILLLPLLPALAAAGIVVLRNRPRVIGPLAVGSLAATLAVGVWAAATEPTIAYRWSSLIELRLAVEGFGRVMVVLVPLVATPIVAYAAATEKEGRARLLALMVAFVAMMLVLVSAADFLSLLVAWELVGALSWALIGHGWRDPANPRAAAQAFLTTRLGDLGLYLAAGAAFAATGSFAFSALGAAGSPARDIVALGVLLAAAAKSAQVPFSPWLFAAMAGPTPVSALLHSATLVAAGAYLLIRLSSALEPVGWFLPAVALIGIVTAISGGVVATVQTHAKRALAASTSAQYGLMFVAVGSGFPAAAGAQLVAHAAFKSLLFLGAGVAIHASGTPRLGGLRLGRALPVAAGLSAVGALGLAAVPPLGAAWSKEAILAAATAASGPLGGAVLAAGFLSALYAARYQLLAYGARGGNSNKGPVRDVEGALEAGDETSGTDEARPAGAGPHPLAQPGPIEMWSMAALASVTVVLSLLWLPGAVGLVEDLAAGPLAAGPPWLTLAALGLLVAAVALARQLMNRGLLLSLGLAPATQARAGDWLGLPSVTTILVVGPVTALSRLLRAFDDRVIDAGVRRAAWLAGVVSHLFSRRFEFAIDGVVRLLAGMTLSTAAGSRMADDSGVDAAVEATGRGVGLAGHQSRRLQTGQSHQYFVIVAAGLALMTAILVVYR